MFKVIAQEEIGVLLPEVQESVADLSRFGKLVKLAGFSPFKSGTNALDNINCISEGLCANYQFSEIVRLRFVNVLFAISLADPIRYSKVKM